MAAPFHRHVYQKHALAVCTHQPSLHQTRLLQRPHAARQFTTTSSPQSRRKRTLPLRELPKDSPTPPPYPYENPQKLYKQHLTGLYGGARIQFGNTVSEHDNRTRRTWEPNVQHKRLYSLALGKFLRVKLTARVLRTVEKDGGIDEYLLASKPQRVKELGPEGWRLRWLVLQTLRANGSERVMADPQLRREIELGDGLAGRGVDVMSADGGPEIELVDEDAAMEEEEDMHDGEMDVEERIQRRLDEDRLMREEVDVRPPSLLQRARNLFRRR